MTHIVFDNEKSYSNVKSFNFHDALFAEAVYVNNELSTPTTPFRKKKSYQ